jgi:hypothetical protein
MAEVCGKEEEEEDGDGSPVLCAVTSYSERMSRTACFRLMSSSVRALVCVQVHVGNVKKERNMSKAKGGLCLPVLRNIRKDVQ